MNLPGWVAVREPRGRPERLSKKTLQSVPPWRAPRVHHTRSSRACHGTRRITRAALHARFLVRPHLCGGCGCSQVHITQREGLARGLDTRVHLLLLSSSAAPRRRSARLSAAATLSHTRGSYYLLPHAVRTRASTTRGIGKRARDDLPRSTRERFALPTRHTCVPSRKRNAAAVRAVSANRHGLFCRCPLWWRRACARRAGGGNSCRALARAPPQRRIALSVGVARPTMSCRRCKRV